MNQSVWLKKYVKNVQKKKRAEISNSWLGILVPSLTALVLGGVLVIRNLRRNVPLESMYFFVNLLVVVAVIVVYSLIKINKCKKVDVTNEIRTTKASINAMIKSDMDMQFFDMEMCASPMRKFSISETSKFFETQNFIGVLDTDNNELRYNFAKKTDVAAIEYFLEENATIQVDIFFEILNGRNKCIFENKAQDMVFIEKIIAILKEFNPEIIVKETYE